MIREVADMRIYINPKLPLLLLFLMIFSFMSIPSKANPQQLPIQQIQLPEGFVISLFAQNIPSARSLTMSPGGTLFVGTRSGGAGRVYALQDLNNDFKADRVYTIASGLNMPNGVAFRNGSLYVGEINRILRFDDIESRLDDPPAPVVVNDNLPSDRHHGWKFIGFGPDGRLYLNVGAPCNVCKKRDNRYASIMRMNPDGSELEVYAQGVRNSVGFDWHPVTEDLWFTDNGRDWLGDDVPPDELNHAPVKGLHFGFPHLHGKDVLDPKYGNGKNLSRFQIPAMELGPHVAALGMRFYTGNMFPGTYQNQIFIAEHGSWNRSVPIGYRITLVRLQGNRALSYEVFAEGWLDGDKSWGRPVDILVLPDGSILISDDKAGAIYRIRYQSGT
jgi:glucose/arabinose dehydrogenase